MIDFSHAKMTRLVIHWVGNKMSEEGIKASSNGIEIDEEIHETLFDHFVGAFKQEEFHRFHHVTDLDLNEGFAYSTQMFASEGSFIAQSVNFLKHLYDQSEHHQIKNGELSVIYLEEMIVDDEVCDAIGVFKTDNKDTFIQYGESGETMTMSFEEGVKLKKVDKGALIFNTEEDDGFRILIVDSSYGETQFWRDSFLQLQRVADESFQTDHYLSLCKGFVDKVMKVEEEDKKEQVLFLNKSLEYFQSHEEFDLDEFTETVTKTPEQARLFNSYKQEAESEVEYSGPIATNFKINQPTLKKAKRKFKNYIKLDTEIEIKLAGKNPVQQEEFVERGYDDAKGMHFYKVYFNKEK